MKTRVALASCLALAVGGPLAAKHYFVSILPEGEAKYKEANFALWVLEGVDALRGVIVHQHGCGEPVETACNDWWFPENGSEAAFLQALARFAEQSGHEELARVPWVLWGHSGTAKWV